jgi:hypothetical protein
LKQRRRALRLAAFLFPLPRSAREGKPREGQKTPFKRLFSFSGCIYLSPTAKRAKRGEKSRENGNGTRNAQRNTAHGRKISPYKPDRAKAPPTTPPTAQTPRKRPKKGNREKARETPTAAGQERPRQERHRSPRSADGIPPKSSGARRHRIRAHARRETVVAVGGLSPLSKTPHYVRPCVRVICRPICRRLFLAVNSVG